MTNKEAIEYLKDVKWHIDLEMSENTQKMYDAIDLAIKALEERPTLRHVIINRSQYGRCDGCYDEARQLVYYKPITKEFVDLIGWKIEEVKE